MILIWKKCRLLCALQGRRILFAMENITLIFFIPVAKAVRYCIKTKLLKLKMPTASPLSLTSGRTYELITRCSGENFIPPSFDDFYVDVNHKLRHNTMRLYGINCSDKLVSVAMTVAESDDGAVLGAVCL